ncbi:MAG: hypothetical protein ACJ0HK_07935 [Akkermansiaceae bacterium]
MGNSNLAQPSTLPLFMACRDRELHATPRETKRRRLARKEYRPHADAGKTALNPGPTMS